jgi:integrase
MNLTMATVRDLTFSEKGKQQFYYDDRLKGFGLRVGETTKSFFAEAKLKTTRKTVRVTIGPYPAFDPKDAREAAKVHLNQILKGIDPNEEKKAVKTQKSEEKAQNKTLNEVLEDFLATRGHKLKERTKGEYKQVISICLADWLNRPLNTINGEQVIKKHREISETRGSQRANGAMRVLRLLFNHGIKSYKLNGKKVIVENPVEELTDLKLWNDLKRRENYIKQTDLKKWWQEVEKQPEFARDFLKVCILTGLRRTEALFLNWKNIDLEAKTLTIENTKNKKDHVLPLGEYLFEIFKRRSSEAITDLVFPGGGSAGQMDEPRKQIKDVIEKSKIEFTLHDLRRSFATHAEGLDISWSAVKRLLNHSEGRDVTAGYIGADIDRLRGAMQRVEDYILKWAGVLAPADVVQIRKSA